MYKRIVAAALAALLLSVVAAPAMAAHLMVGNASWYGPGFNGKKTASGQRFNQNAMTAAHKTLPMGTCVVVVNKLNGKKVRVTINDRGPYAKGRVIDLSKAAAIRIGMIQRGTAPVALTRCS